LTSMYASHIQCIARGGGGHECRALTGAPAPFVNAGSIEDPSWCEAKCGLKFVVRDYTRWQIGADSRDACRQCFPLQ
jgi:hypothetical protein